MIIIVFGKKDKHHQWEYTNSSLQLEMGPLDFLVVPLRSLLLLEEASRDHEEVQLTYFKLVRRVLQPGRWRTSTYMLLAWACILYSHH